MHYLLLGTDHQKKSREIRALRDALLPGPDAREFDYSALYGHKLSAKELKETLIQLPALAAQRLVVLFEAHKLDAQALEILAEFLQLDQAATAVVVESDAWGRSAAAVKKLAAHVTIQGDAVEVKGNVFDVTTCVARGQAAGAVASLRALLERGDRPLLLMGGIVWFWGNKARGRVSSAAFEKGLQYLQEADVWMKRTKIQSEYALEVLVTKLSALMAS